MGNDFLRLSVSLTIMAYELIRSIDAAHAHSTKTLSNYSSHYNHLERFALATHVPMNTLFPVKEPSSQLVDGSDYYFAWHHVDLSMSGGRRNKDGVKEGRTFATIRGHRSSIYHMFHEQDLHSPTDSPMFSNFISGLRRRLGDASVPAWAITINVILAAQQHFASEFDRLHWQAIPGLLV